MRWLLFLSKVTFICNICFILCLLLRHTHITFTEAFSEFVIIQGWLMSVVFNVLFGAAVIAARAGQRPTDVPVWIIAANFAAMLLQLFYYLFFYA